MTVVPLLLVLLPLLHGLRSVPAKSPQPCFFPESDIRPFFYDVHADLAPGTVIAESVVDPPRADILLASVRSEKPIGINFTERFELKQRRAGRFQLVLMSNLSLPSKVDVMKLFVTVVCNDEAFPLFTVRVRSNDSTSPQFYNEPYHIEVNETLRVGDTVITPVVVVDWDSENSPPKLRLEDSNSPFKVVADQYQNQPVARVNKNQTSSRNPTLVLLKLVRPIDHLPITLKLVAENSLDRTSETLIHIRAKSKNGKDRPKIQASKIQKSRPIILEEENDSLHQSEPRLSEDAAPDADVPLKNSRSRPNKPHSDKATRFDQCSVSVAMPENSEVGTLVTTLKVLNRKNWTMIDMVNPDGTFDIRQNTGEVFVRDNRIMDRELFTNLELVAVIHGSSHLTECSRTRVNVELLDENDNKPAFEKEKYVFILANEFPVDSSIGIVRARDIDEGEAGRVSYRILNESVPFEIRPKGKDAEIIVTSDLDGFEDFHLIIEAQDNAPPFLSSQIPVDILIQKSKLKSSSRKTTMKKISGATSATSEPVELEEATASETVQYRSTTPTSSSSSTSTSPSSSSPSTAAAETTTTEAPPTSRRRSTTTRPRTTTQVTATSRQRVPSTSSKHVHPTLISEENLERVDKVDSTTESPESEQSGEEYTSSESEEVRTTVATDATFDFVQPAYYYEVFGAPHEGDVLGRVEARPRAQFYGVDRKMAGSFKIDPDLGEIVVGRGMDRLGNGNHTFEVSATNGLHTAHTVVTVRLDTSRSRTDAAPRFERDRYVFSVPENRPPSVVGVVRAYHVALSSNNVTLRYELLSGSTTLPFRVHAISGEVTSEIVLDHETNKNFEFKIRACLSANPGRCGFTSVVVVVLDVNDNAPQFSSSLFQISLPSDLPTGSDVVTLQATDSDSGINGDVNYAINPPSEVFGIDYHTGVVQTLAALTESQYELDVEAFDHGDPKQTAVARLSIAVHGTNPSAPVFDQRRYSVVLNSPIRAGAVVAQLHAKDPDPGLEGQISYRLEQLSIGGKETTEARKFSINEQTGVVSALTTLTTQDGPFDMVVIAEDQSTVFKRKTSATLHVEIVGDTSLRFLPLPSTIYISTEKAVGSVVLRASAFTSSAHPVQFRVLETESQFVMDGDLMRVATHLVPGETNLTIRAEADNAHSDHRLRVVVMFDRDKYPVFPQLTYDIDIPIDSHFPLVVHRFDAQLLNGTLRYRFFPDGTAPEGLQIDPNTGELSVTSAYARTPSNHDTQFVVVRAVNMDYPDFYSDVGVAISLISSRKIRFPHSIYRLQITEKLPVGTILFPPIEVFPATPSVSYSISPATPLSILPNGTLVINSPIDLEELPVDQTDSLYFVVTATVRDVSAVTKVQLKIKDLNEFSPQFDKPLYEVVLAKNSSPGSTIVKVRANDADRTDGTHLLYKVVGGSGSSFVFIQEDGTLILGEKPLNAESVNSFDVVVEAMDRSGNKDTTTVHVKVGDGGGGSIEFPSPFFSWNVSEGSINDTLDITASDSGQNGDLVYRIVRGNSGNRFAIEKTSSNRTVLKIVSPLDYEARTSYKLLIEARHRGEPAQAATVVVNVTVTNRNDNAPIFQRINIEQEAAVDLPIGYPILTLTVNDADRDRLTFSLSGDPGCSSLAVDPLGIVSFSKPISKRTPGTVVCVVSATDGVHTANAMLRLNVLNSKEQTGKPPPENRAPRFGKEIYTITVNSSQTNQLLKKVTATDPDGDVVVYSIEPPEFRNLFAVDAEGQLSVRVPISDLKQSLYSFLVVGEDQGKPIMSSFTNIRVRVQEDDVALATASTTKGYVSTSTTSPPKSSTGSWTASKATLGGGENMLLTTSALQSKSTASPASTARTKWSSSPSPSPPTSSNREVRFARRKYTFAIPTSASVGTYLGQVEVNDSEVSLTFKETKQFSIDGEGWIHTATAFEGPTKVEDKILAKKQGVTVAETDFVVHVLNTEPVNASTSVSASSGSAATFTDITADPTSPTVSGSTSAPNSPSSTIVPSTTSLLPSTETDALTTADTITPSVPSSTFSFARPMYFAFVPEGQYTNGIRLSVKPESFSVNRNTSVRYEIDESADHIPFFLTSDGQLIIFDVDREARASYMFPIKATSAEYGVARATVNVTILDVNDNYPVLNASPSALGVYNDVAVGTPLFHFSAHDRDADNYGTITYGIEESDVPFDIDPHDGTLFVSQSLSSNLVDEFPITVFARDNGRPSLKSTHKVTIHVFDPANDLPMFPAELHDAVVFLGTQPGTEVATLLAGPTINTRPSQEKILYSLVDNYNGLFEMEDSGRLVLARQPLVEEQNRYVQLNITAENSHGKTWTVLNVLVEGEVHPTEEVTTNGSASSDKCYFPTKVYNAEIMENREGRNRVAKVTSSCEIDSLPFLYSMSPASQDFELNPSTGEIFAIRPLDREKRTFHFLYISVSSGGSESEKRPIRQSPVIDQAKAKLTESETLVVVRVLDENDNAPRFVRVNADEPIVATIDWQARLFSPVLKLEAKDADERAQLSYSLSGSDHEYFLVNATNGLVILAKTISDYSGESLEFNAIVSDGVHHAEVPVMVHVISPSSSLVQLTSEVPHSQLDQRSVERTLNQLTGLDNRLLAKQPFVDQQGHADPTRSHLFVYALDRNTSAPLAKEDLVKVLEHHAAPLLSSPSKISEISLLMQAPTAVSTFDFILAIIVVGLLLLLLAACCVLSSYCKRKRAVATSDREYMVTAKAGPRPYDVEAYSRTTAQRVLSARPLPDPLTNQIEVAVSPIFMDQTLTTNKSDTMQDFSNSVRERPSLLQSALARQKVHSTASWSTEQSHT